ncbi:MAG: heme ABC exporter ATP-binding protein CcmA [Oceanococcus sp.]|nr:MAG: heme ABC exporter ATP-binding protein CcmA [Oceanococcus sp.]
MSEAILSATNLWLRRGERELFNGYSLQLHAADVLWLRAPNGRGKTTLLRILAGLVTPETGRLSWRGQGFASRMDESRQAIGFLDERLGLSRDLSVADNLRYIADTCATQTAVAIDTLELAPLLARRVGQLSTGQKKRVGMARLLLENAVVWLLDEPANGLDDTNRARLSALIEAHRAQGGVCVFASHDELPLARPPRIETLEGACAA